ncbi:MAG: biopolymer transporter ExbD [Myxococcota bacterium]|jgi:biopolymer transport protein ExbD|nr:biopolymer transporter ExbD [Myxococcota bacterium]
MAGFKTDNDDEAISDINVTPFVDVVLVVLIIFIVTASAIVRAAIVVDLPKASNAQTEVKPPVSIIIGCAQKQAGAGQEGCTPGSVLVDGEEVIDLSAEDASVDPLVTVLRSKIEEAKRSPSLDEKGEAQPVSVLITADKDLRFQNVIWLMDLCKNEGFGAIMFNSELFTRPEEVRSLPQRD